MWSCRGATSTTFFRYCKQYMDMYHPDIIDPHRLQKTGELLGFDGFQSYDVRGYAGGILWLGRRSKFQL